MSLVECWKVLASSWKREREMMETFLFSSPVHQTNRTSERNIDTRSTWNFDISCILIFKWFRKYCYVFYLSYVFFNGYFTKINANIKIL